MTDNAIRSLWLAMDTAGPDCSVALADGDHILAQKSQTLGRGHAERLMPMLDEVLADAGAEWSAIGHIAVTTGPGSFTGLRVGLATARGLALALGVPCHGVTVLEAMGAAFGANEPLIVAMDAKRDQIWWQAFDAKARAGNEPQAGSVEDISAFIGNGSHRMAGSAARLLDMTSVSDAASAPIAAVLAAAQQQSSPTAPPSAFYLRAPDAKPQTVVGAS